MHTVLDVDDRPDARDSLADPLTAVGFDVREHVAGAAAYFTKAFDPRVLVAAVRTVLGDGGASPNRPA